MSLTPLDPIHQDPGPLVPVSRLSLTRQPCPAGHGASVPGGRGRSHQDPEALHPEGPALSLSFPPHSRKNRDQRTQDTGTEEGLETQQKTRGDPSSLGRTAPGRDAAWEAATHTCRQLSVHGGVTRDACPRPHHLTPEGEEMTGMGERESNFLESEGN